MATTTRPKLADVAKHPAAYILMVLLPLVGFFAHSLTGAQGGRVDDCNEEVRYLRSELARSHRLIEQQAFDLKVKDATIDHIPAATDSLLHQN